VREGTAGPREGLSPPPLAGEPLARQQDLLADGTLHVFRGAKLRLVDVDPGLIEQAMRPGHTLVARIRLTDARGNPICARVHPPYLTWSAAAD
jgi:hypothetical protein